MYYMETYHTIICITLELSYHVYYIETYHTTIHIATYVISEPSDVLHGDVPYHHMHYIRAELSCVLHRDVPYLHMHYIISEPSRPEASLPSTLTFAPHICMHDCSLPGRIKRRARSEWKAKAKCSEFASEIFDKHFQFPALLHFQLFLNFYCTYIATSINGV